MVMQNGFEATEPLNEKKYQLMLSAGRWYISYALMDATSVACLHSILQHTVRKVDTILTEHKILDL